MEDFFPTSTISPIRSDSSNASFATAVQTPHKTDRLTAVPGDDSGLTTNYCDAVPLRRELESQCQILIEEKLCESGVLYGAA